MDSRASTSVLAGAQTSKSMTINTTNHSTMVSSRGLTYSSPYTTFRSSPLNPSQSPPSTTEKPAYFSGRNSTFPASRPLRPFPSISQSLANAKPVLPESDMFMRHDPGAPSPKIGETGVVTAGKRSPKTIEISSKWRGGFFVIGMTQAEFSRRD